MKKQKLLLVLMSMSTAAGVALISLPPSAFAAAGDTQQTTSDQTATDPSTTPGVPYQKTFVISAYYSPVQGQKKYVTGSYDGDIRLNGSGVHGADGTDTHPGMIAAPKNYPFGTKMQIPGIGMVAVHDRGGAIVNAGERNQSYDRLDLWMGFGDAGLQRALSWGRRKVDVTVYGIDPTKVENVDLQGYTAAESTAEVLTGQAPKMFVQDLSLGDQNDDVKKLQTGLKQLSYYSGDVTGTFDETTREALAKFQIDMGIVDTMNDFGAGYFGPQTRKTLEDKLTQGGDTDSQGNDDVTEHMPQTTLSKFDQGDDVKKLQQALAKLGYNVQVTGVYDDQTVQAVLQFQKDQNLVSSVTDFGAGVFGPKTMQLLASKLSGVTFDSANAAASTVQPVDIFTTDLALGDSGADVTRLQQELKRMNLLGIDPSGYYGSVTQHAVMKFQESEGLIQSETQSDAGYFGQSTRDRIQTLISERNDITQKIAENTPAKKEDTVALK